MEATAFKRSMTLLRDGIQDHIDKFATDLYSRELISQDVWQKAILSSHPAGPRATNLLGALENRIRTKPGDYRTVIDILHSQAHLCHLVGPLEAEFQQLPDLQHSTFVATRPRPSLPYLYRGEPTQGLPSPVRLPFTDFRNDATSYVSSPSEQTDKGIPHQRPTPSRSSTGLVSESEEGVSTMFQQPVCAESPLPGTSFPVLPTGNYSSVKQKIQQTMDILNDVFVELPDQYEIAQLENQVVSLQLSKLEDAQRYEKKLADAERDVQEFRSLLFTVSKQLDSKDKKIASQKEEIDNLTEEVKRCQFDKESQASAIVPKEQEFRAEQAEKKQQEIEHTEVHRLFKALEAKSEATRRKFNKMKERYCALQDRKRKTLSWP